MKQVQYSRRGLSPHQIMPVSGAHSSLGADITQARCWPTPIVAIPRVPMCRFILLSLLICCRLAAAEEAGIPKFKTAPQKYVHHTTVGGASGIAERDEELLIG